MELEDASIELDDFVPFKRINNPIPRTENQLSDSKIRFHL